MILDEEADLSVHTDLCIVGAGPVGLALAFKCASKGLSVTVIEAGTNGRRQSVVEPGPLDIVNPHHADADQISARGIGGTSRLWGGRCVKLDDIDFTKRSYVPFSGWPISHRDISRYYDEALTFLGCRTEEDYSFSPPEPGSKADVTTTVIERWSAKPRLKELHGRRLRASERIRVFTHCVAREIRLDANGEHARSLLVERNGKLEQVKASMFVLACGGLENARLLMTTRRSWPQKFGGMAGPLGRFYTGHLTGYLARICFEDRAFCELFRFQKDGKAHFRHRLALSFRTQVAGEYLNTAFWPESHSIADPAHGSGALSIAYLGLSSLKLYGRLRRGLAPYFGGADSDTVRRHWSNVRNDRNLFRSGFAVSAHFLRNRFGTRTYSLFNPQDRYLLRYHAEQVPDPSNRVSLADAPDGSLNTPLKVEYSFLPQDAASVVKSHDLLDRWLRQNRLGYLEYLAPPDDRSQLVLSQAVDGYHQLGLTRMSNGGREGVVDGDCRVHDISNLFVAGSSVFPTAGQANPTLPAVALAMRLGDHLARQCGIWRLNGRNASSENLADT